MKGIEEVIQGKEEEEYIISKGGIKGDIIKGIQKIIIDYKDEYGSEKGTDIEFSGKVKEGGYVLKVWVYNYMEGIDKQKRYTEKEILSRHVKKEG